MVSKFVFTSAFAFLALVCGSASASVEHVPHVYNAVAPVVVKSEEYDPHPQYKFSYGVNDQLTGDSKSQVEERDGDVVRGEYSLIDADGYKRTVQYTSDPHNGFNAVVNREPLVKAVPIAVAPAPVVKTYTAPVAHYAAPVTQYAAPTVVRAVAPVTHYSVSSVVKSHVVPAAYVRNAPVAYSAPAGHYAAYSPPVAAYHH